MDLSRKLAALIGHLETERTVDEVDKATIAGAAAEIDRLKAALAEADEALITCAHFCEQDPIDNFKPAIHPDTGPAWHAAFDRQAARDAAPKAA